jgi:hypothetical protein
MADMERALDEHLRTHDGAPDEDIPTHAPGMPGELGRLLAVAARLRRVSAPAPGASPSSRIRARVLAHVREHPRSSSPLVFPSFRPAYTLILAALLALSAGTAAAQASVPGDFLHGWKLAGERVARALYPDRLGFDIFLAERRAGELLAVGVEPEAEEATQAFADSLRILMAYTAESERIRVRLALSDERARLQEAGFASQEIETLFLALGFPSPVLVPSPGGSVLATPTTQWLPTLYPLPTLDLP